MGLVKAAHPQCPVAAVARQIQGMARDAGQGLDDWSPVVGVPQQAVQQYQWYGGIRDHG